MCWQRFLWVEIKHGCLQKHIYWYTAKETGKPAASKGHSIKSDSGSLTFSSEAHVNCKSETIISATNLNDSSLLELELLVFAKYFLNVSK